MGLFKSVSKAVKKATKGVSKTVKKVSRDVGKGVSDGFRTGVTGQLEYLTVKPLEYLAPKVIELAGRAKGLVGQASQVVETAKSTVAENQGLFSMIPGMENMGGLFGGGAAVAPAAADYTPTDTPAPSVPVWVWIAAAGAAVVGLVLILKRKS